jgi:hypothetical protein
MLANKNQAIVSGLLGLGVAGFAVATALPFNDRIEYRIGNRIDSQPAWLVPPKAEFRAIERGYGGIKILLALLATGGMVTVMLIARKEGEQEPIRQRIKQYQNKAYEFGFAAESAYQMSTLANRYKKLADADEVAFEGEIEAAYCESLGIDPQQQQPALTGTTTLDSVANPGDKVEAATAATIEPEADRTTGPKMPVLTNYPSVLIYGAPGSGKTTFAEQEVKRRLEAGHRVIVCDPHAAYGAWAGCEVVGGGMNYAAIDAKLEWFAEEVRRRYKLIESQPNPQFKPLTLVCDEFTNWAARCSAAGEFFQSALSDIRKAKMFGLIVSHTRTMAGLANAAGMAKLRDEALLEVELLGQQCPKTGDAVPRFEALIKLPGESLNNRKIFKIAKLDTPQNNVISTLPNTYSTDTDATPGNSGKLAESDPENFGNPYGTRAERLEAFLADVLAETLPPVFSEDFPLSEQSDRVQLAKLVIARNLGKEKTIWLLWGVRPGGRNHAVYSEARAMLDRLIRGSGQGNN